MLYYIVYRDFITKLIIGVSSFTITPISIYIVYRDFITTLIIGVLSFTITPISTCSLALLVRYRNACLRLFVVILQDIYIVYRDFISTLFIGVLHFTIIQIFTFRGAIVSEIQYSLPEAICCFITRFTLFTEILSQR